MEGLGFKRLLAMVAMLALNLGVFSAQVQSDHSCYENCAWNCFDSRMPNCYSNCVTAGHCHDFLTTSLGHCELGCCKITECIGLKSGPHLVPQY